MLATKREEKLRIGVRLVMSLAAILFIGNIALGQNSLFLNNTNQERGSYGERGEAGRVGYGPGAGQPMIMADEVGTNTYQGSPVLQASWITVEEPRLKNFRVHDLVTIVVNEVSRHSTSAETQTERSYGLDAALEEWFRLTHGAVYAADATHGEPSLALSFSREQDGSGEISRQDSLTARIRAEVVDVLPNGNLVLEATHSVTTDDETSLITLTGICAGSDLGLDNTVLSSQLASLRVEKTHTGMARDATRRGVISGFLEFLNLL